MGRGGTPAREISFVSLVAYGPKVSDSASTMGGLQLLKPGRVVANTIFYVFNRLRILAPINPHQRDAKNVSILFLFGEINV